MCYLMKVNFLMNWKWKFTHLQIKIQLNLFLLVFYVWGMLVVLMKLNEISYSSVSSILYTEKNSSVSLTRIDIFLRAKRAFCVFNPLNYPSSSPKGFLSILYTEKNSSVSLTLMTFFCERSEPFVFLICWIIRRVLWRASYGDEKII